MAHIIHIQDIHSPELALFARLTDGQLRSRREPEQGVFIAESFKVIDCALRAGFRPLALLMEERHLLGQGAQLASRCGDIPLYTAGRPVLAQLTGYELTRGFLCAFRRRPLPSLEEVCAGASRLAVLEGLTDPTNVGAVFRSAAALGMDGVLLSPTCCDPLHRRAVRVSMGGVFQIPWSRIGREDGWPGESLARLENLGFLTAAMALDSRALSIDDSALSSARRLAVLLGSEGNGLSPETIARCRYTVRIPMAPGVDSLNVAAAAAVAFWQLRRR